MPNQRSLDQKILAFTLDTRLSDIMDSTSASLGNNRSEFIRRAIINELKSTMQNYRICTICKKQNGKSSGQVGSSVSYMCLDCKKTTRHAIVSEREKERCVLARNKPRRKPRTGGIIGLGLGFDMD